MEPAPSDTAELVHRVRQQLILAQVRIMELEDERDDCAGQLSEINKLLATAQLLADQKIEEATHLTKVREDLHAQYEHMRHMQHVTNEALNLTRQQLETATSYQTQLQSKTTLLNGKITALDVHLGELTQQLGDSRNASTLQQERINRLETELSQIKATRSWRWTSWLR